MKKLNAYLIIAHQDFSILQKILKILDDPEADFFLHIDKKVKQVPWEDLKASVTASSITFVPSINVQWGSAKQIESELILMREALKGQYRYFHLLSGVDMPLKPPKEINHFFKEHDGTQFLDIDEVSMISGEHLHRIAQYHFFQQMIGRNQGILPKTCLILQKGLLLMQKVFHVNRIRSKEDFFWKGSNWFSITSDLARFVVQETEKQKKTYAHSICADEVFLQTTAMASPYKDQIIRSNLRLIDWKRGNPYTFRKTDLEELTTSDALFARKFSTQVDSEIIDLLYQYLMQQKQED